jgi:hypothetical protein
VQLEHGNIPESTRRSLSSALEGMPR